MSLDLNKLAAAKLWLISTGSPPLTSDSPRDLPYLATALYALVPVSSMDVDRMTCDEWWRIYINPGWLALAPVSEVARELAHVTWHLLADHTGRARDQDVDRSTAKPWARAADVAVSNTLTPDLLRPAELPTPSNLPAKPDLSVEEYFLVTQQIAQRASSSDVSDGDSGGADSPAAGGCGGGADGQSRPYEYAEGANIGAVSTFDANEIRRVVAVEAAQHARQRGSEPGSDLRQVLDRLEPRTPWQSLLSGAVRRAVGWAAGRGEYTYNRPSRRSGSVRGVVLPGQHRPVPRLSIIVDTSYSVDDGLLAQALGEIDGALAALGVPGSNATVYSVDAAVHTVKKVRRAKDTKLVGAGGTDLRHGLKAAQEERPRPDVIIVLTDGDTPWPAQPPPGAAVIAALLGRSSKDLPPSPTWALRVECVVGG